MFTEFDVIVCVVVAGFAIASFASGFIKDVLTLFAYICAGLATLYFQPFVALQFHSLISNESTRSIISVAAIFLPALLFCLLINAVLLDFLRSSRKGSIDRSLGLLFGLIKGIALVSVIHLVIISSAEEEPEWLHVGETYLLTSWGSSIVEEHVWRPIQSAHAQLEESEITDDNDNNILYEGDDSLLADPFDQAIERAKEVINE